MKRKRTKRSGKVRFAMYAIGGLLILAAGIAGAIFAVGAALIWAARKKSR